MHMPDAGPYRRDHGSVRVPGFQVSYSIVEIMMVNRKAAEKEAGRAHVQTYLGTPTDLKHEAVREIAAGLKVALADVFALYIKTKNFHWHMSGRHFRDYHLLLDEQGEQIFAMTDPMAERARKIGGNTLHSVGEIARLTAVADNDAEYVTPENMLAELREDNLALTARLRAVHALCDEGNDVATASLLENWIDETERRTWFLFEATRPAFGRND